MKIYAILKPTENECQDFKHGVLYDFEHVKGDVLYILKDNIRIEAPSTAFDFSPPKQYRMISYYFGFKSYVDATIYNLDTIEDATIFTEGIDDDKYQKVLDSFAVGHLGPFEKEYI